MRIPVYILRNYLFIAIGILFFIVASFFFKLNLFGEDLYEDGFFSQINFISNADSGMEGLGYIHYARFVSVYAFFMIWLLKLPNFYNAVLLSAILIPILFFNAKQKKFNPLQLLILFLPFFFSIRVSLGACSFGYLYVYLFSERKNLILLIISLLFSMLSSGTFICYFLILFFYRKSFSKNNPILFKSLVVILSVSIIVAVQNKYQGVSEGASGYSDEGESYTGLSSIWGLLIRGTLIESLKKAQYARAVAYSALYLIGVFLVVMIASKRKIKKEYLGFFIPMLIMFWFEGMGFISYQYCLLLFPLYNITITNATFENRLV
ncbi:hypothetical protein DBR43_23925 [Pedobacter sp. KBW06]|uniref:hypothetical protein n=1 Tax=Pedobacter sp. KBW06 TaxID=2153359 RepID=UPI000F5A7F24|nr:hypothetical protein [Pedobacter sp. KBW06]RQO67575.1 hypothetical protein DBR43_23925 [Pedobacter sp. KBW06]